MTFCLPCCPCIWLTLPCSLPTGEKIQKALQAEVDGVSEHLQAGLQATGQQADAASVVPTVVGAVMQRDAQPQPAASKTLGEQIKELNDLKTQGVLTDEEFAAAKARLLQPQPMI